MHFVGPHSRKINRAARLAETGCYPGTFLAMFYAIPAATVAALTAAQLAELIDSTAALADNSKAISAREIISDGGVWDAQKNQFRELARQ